MGQNQEISQSAFDHLFEGLVLTESNAEETIRCVVELTFFEFRMRGISKGKSQRTQERIHHILSLSPDQQVPPHLIKLANDEQSHIGRRQATAKELVFTCIRNGESRQMILPFSIFLKETKRRIFRYFAVSIREAVRAVQEGYNPTALKRFAAMLHDLANRCDAKYDLTRDDQVVFLRASWAEAKARYDELKLKLQYASPSEDTGRIERRLKQIQNEASTFAAELQKVIDAAP